MRCQAVTLLNHFYLNPFASRSTFTKGAVPTFVCFLRKAHSRVLLMDVSKSCCFLRTITPLFLCLTSSWKLCNMGQCAQPSRADLGQTGDAQLPLCWVFFCLASLNTERTTHTSHTTLLYYIVILITSTLSSPNSIYWYCRQVSL